MSGRIIHLSPVPQRARAALIKAMDSKCVAEGKIRNMVACNDWSQTSEYSRLLHIIAACSIVNQSELDFTGVTAENLASLLQIASREREARVSVSSASSSAPSTESRSGSMNPASLESDSAVRGDSDDVAVAKPVKKLRPMRVIGQSNRSLSKTGTRQFNLSTIVAGAHTLLASIISGTVALRALSSPTQTSIFFVSPRSAAVATVINSTNEFNCDKNGCAEFAPNVLSSVPQPEKIFGNDRVCAHNLAFELVTRHFPPFFMNVVDPFVRVAQCGCGRSF